MADGESDLQFLTPRNIEDEAYDKWYNTKKRTVQSGHRQTEDGRGRALALGMFFDCNITVVVNKD